MGEPAAVEPALRLAVRCQHIQRWKIPRSDYPGTPQGYQQWRGRLMKFHADTAAAILRELREEVGLTDGQCEFFGLYSRKAGWATNLIALYTVRDGITDFRPNWEIREMLFAPLDAPPPGTTPGTLRRLAELGGAPRGDIW